ncbi:MAG: NUDIX domain-containing protein [Oscillospiraceae bacterium]|nr:NUDIX domain-containing protein [Oscillospiraceae bacterium]
MKNNLTIHSGKLRNMASVYLRKNDKLLLLYRQGRSIVSDLWIGSAGGHFEKGEVNDAKACMVRELYEELSVTDESLQNLSLRYVTLRYADGEIRQNYYFFADLVDSITPLSNEGQTRWFALRELSELPMPFTARCMIDHYISTGQFDDSLYGGIANDDGVIFTKL